MHKFLRSFLLLLGLIAIHPSNLHAEEGFPVRLHRYEAYADTNTQITLKVKNPNQSLVVERLEMIRYLRSVETGAATPVKQYVIVVSLRQKDKNWKHEPQKVLSFTGQDHLTTHFMVVAPAEVDVQVSNPN